MESTRGTFSFLYDHWRISPTATTLKVTSMDGKLMREIVLSHVQDQIIIDTKSLSNGTYILTIADNKVLYKKAKLEVIH